MRRLSRFGLLVALLLSLAGAAWAADGDILERKPMAVPAGVPYVAEQIVYESDAGCALPGFWPTRRRRPPVRPGCRA